MKKWNLLFAVCLFAVSTEAETVIFKMDGDDPVTGDLLDGIGATPVTTNVVEISDLLVTAHTGGADQKINGTGSSSSMGVTIRNSGDNTTRFDYGESLTLSFNRKVEITKFDLVGFNSNSVFNVAVEGQQDPLEITYFNLSNKSAQIYSNSTLVVEKDFGITFSVDNTNSVIGLQTMDVTVLEESGILSLSIIPSNSASFVSVVFNEAPNANYVLQCSSNLASNDWATVCSFSSSTNLSFESTNQCGFFRATVE